MVFLRPVKVRHNNLASLSSSGLFPFKVPSNELELLHCHRHHYKEEVIFSSLTAVWYRLMSRNGFETTV